MRSRFARYPTLYGETVKDGAPASVAYLWESPECPASNRIGCSVIWYSGEKIRLGGMHLVWCEFCTGCLKKGAKLGITFEVFRIFGADDYTVRVEWVLCKLKLPG